MKKLLMFAFVALFLLGAMAFATDTRVMTMGNANNIVKDEANIWLYPSTINMYPDMFIGEFYNDGSTDFWQAGLHLKFRKDTESPLVLGAYFSDMYYSHAILNDYYGYWGTPSRLDLFLGMPFGGNPMGLHIGLYGASAKQSGTPSSDYDYSLSRYEFDLGGTFGNIDVAAGLALVSWTDKEWETAPDPDGLYDETKPDGNTEFYVMGRLWHNMGDWTVIPHAGISIGKQGLEAFDWNGSAWATDMKHKYSSTVIGAGLGGNLDAGSGILIVTDIGITYNKFKEEVDSVDVDKTTNMALPYFVIGIDAKVFNWLDLRAGAVNVWQRNKDEVPDTDYEYKNSYAQTDTYLGVGFHWNNLTLDAELNPDFLGNGPDFVSGTSTDEMFPNVTLKYNF